jgi:hypothetical protein
MKFKNIILSALVSIACSGGIKGNESKVLDSCRDFKKYVKLKYLKSHDGMCLIENGNPDTPNLLGKIKFIYPIITSEGRPCNSKEKDCSTFIILNWHEKASLGVLVSKDIFKNGGFSGDDLEPTLTYLREKTGIKFSRKN